MQKIESRSEHENVLLKALTRAYLSGRSRDFQTANATWKEFVQKIELGVFSANDITVEAGGVLVVDRDVDLLKARNILIKTGGRMVINGSGLTIRCKSLKGESAPPRLPVRPPFLGIRFRAVGEA